MAKKSKLRAPKGTDEANIGGTSFRVDNDGTIDVPEGEVGPLLERGGFVEVLPPVEIPHGHALVRHDDPTASTDVGERHGDGFLVPVHLVNVLASHGFKAVDHVTETAAEIAADDKQPKASDAPTGPEPAATDSDAVVSE